jgi:hypothetical protein
MYIFLFLFLKKKKKIKFLFFLHILILLSIFQIFHHTNFIFLGYKGTDVVKGIVLKLPLQKHERLNVEAFSKMKKLKMLEISRKHCPAKLSKARHNLRTLEWHGDPSSFMLSNELCIMEWWGYPLESLPASFQLNNLVELIMPYSCAKQPWDGRKVTFWLMQVDFLFLPLNLVHFVGLL